MLEIRLFRNIRLGTKNLLLHKLRSLLTVLGLVFGVGSVIAMLAVGEGASQKALDDIRKLGSNNIIISSIKPTNEDGSSSASGKSFVHAYGLRYEDEARIRETMPGIKRTVPVKIIRKKAAFGLTYEQTEMRIVGVSEGWFDLVRREKLAGRTLTRHDGDRSAYVCVLTEHGARTILAGGHTIGRPVSLGDAIYEVVGIVRSEHGGEHVPDMRSDAYIPNSTFIDRY